MNTVSTDRSFKVGDWTVNPSLDQLSRDGRTKTVSPLVMAVVVYMAQRPGQLVTADELISEVWGGSIVSDRPVYQSLTRVRQALGDDSHNPRYIQTIPKKGYRLIAPVTVCDRTDKVDIASAGLRPVRVFGSVVSLFLAGTYMFVASSDVANPRVAHVPKSFQVGSIAVLPFVDMSDDQSQKYLADGISEELIHALSNVPGLRVAARTSAFRFADKDVDIPTIGDQLNVATVLEGSVRKIGDQVRITAQLVNVADGYHLWSKSFDRFPDIYR